MKNKLLIITILLGVFAASCRKDEYVFEQTPDERVNEALTKYQAILSGAAAGWKATIEPALGGQFHYFFQFNNDNRVFMFADFDTTTAGTKGESSYRLKALQQPSLIFDTYSYLHMLADPEGAVNGGINGIGLGSDFEFIFLSANEDSVVLRGLSYETKLKLERATQAELDAWQNGQWLSSLRFLNIQKIETYFRRLTLGGVSYEIVIDPISRAIRFQWLEGGNLQTFITTYSYNQQGVVLAEPLVNGSQTISVLSGISWNEATKTLQLSAAGLTGTVSGAVAPIRVDAQATTRWRNRAINADTYWYSGDGFSSSNVADIFQLGSLSRYYYYIYWPEYETAVDMGAPVFLNAAGDGLTLQYGAAFEVPTISNGKAYFDYLGSYGTHPSSGAAYQTLLQFLETEGYYMVQVNNSRYDMVSAKDAKTWISWILAE